MLLKVLKSRLFLVGIPEPQMGNRDWASQSAQGAILERL